METVPSPFVPPAPQPHVQQPSKLEMIRIAHKNPLELWGDAAYNDPYVSTRGIGGHLIIANDPELIRHILVDNAKNYRMGETRQLILRPILRDGLLTAEGEAWKRTRKALAPVFAPRNIFGFASQMRERAVNFSQRYEELDGGTVDVASDMAAVTYDILAETLFSREIAADPTHFAQQIDVLLETMGRVDPLDALRAPHWLPRVTRWRGRRHMANFRKIVAETTAMRVEKMRSGQDVPNDFLTLLLSADGPNGLTPAEIQDNIVTFIGAGHETTARALGWTIYCLAEAPWERLRVEMEIDAVVAREPDPVKWLDAMPYTRAAFEEAMRLYPPAPTLSREPIESETWRDLHIPARSSVVVMPWTLHRHRKLWTQPDAFMPQRFHPGHRDKIDRFQYLPFGAGPRTCIGASFAMQEAMIVLATLLSRYRFETLPETNPWPVQKVTVQPEGGLPMMVTPRYRLPSKTFSTWTGQRQDVTATKSKRIERRA